MARYKLIAPAYINDRLYSQEDIDAAGEAGITIDFEGKVRPEDAHLQLVEGAKNEKQAADEARATDDQVRAKAIAAKLTENGAAGGKLINADTPADVVNLRWADYLSSNPFK